MTMRQTLGLTLAVCATATGFAGAAERPRGPRLETLFPHQAAIYVDEDRLSRLPLPPEVLGACRPDLSDLRVFDAAGREVPYLIDSGSDLDARLAVTERVTPGLLGVERQEMHRDDAPALRREVYRLRVPSRVPATGRWDLVLTTAQRQFVQRIDVDAIDGSGASTPLVAEGSVWRLPSPSREHLRLVLPALPPGATELTVRLESEESQYLSPGFELESSRSLDPRRRVEVPLEEIGRRQDGDRTIVDLERPRGLVPDRLRLHTATPSFHRDVQVWDEGQGRGDEILGRESLFRLRALVPVGDDEVPIRAARGDRLRIVIEDGDSPPLEALRFTAVLGGPAILVSLTPRGAEPAGTLRFGGGRAFRPRYDLAGLVPARLPVSGSAADVAIGLYDVSQLAAARLGPIEPNPRFDPSPTLAFAMRAGAEIDRRVYTHRRQIQARPSAEGLNRLAVRLEDLARARPDLADLRIVDEQGHQWAYLVAQRAANLHLDLGHEGPMSEAGRSHYELALPSAPATLSRVVIETTVPFFDRPYVLQARRGTSRITLAQGRLSRRIGDPRPLAIGFAPTRVEELELEIEDGDDAPLELGGVEGRFPVPELYFAAPAGSYSLLVGDAEAHAPRYELATVRDIVLAIESAPVSTEELEENPDLRRGARWASGTGRQRVLLWGALGLAVAGLAYLTLRLARAPQAEP